MIAFFTCTECLLLSLLGHSRATYILRTPCCKSALNPETLNPTHLSKTWARTKIRDPYNGPPYSRIPLQ